MKPLQDEEALLVAGALADSAGFGRAARGARWALLGGDPSPAARREARLHLGRSLLAAGQPRLSLALVEPEEMTGADAALLAANARAAIRDTLGAASRLSTFAITRGVPTADRHAASIRAAAWLTGARSDSLPEPLWLDLLRTLGEIGESERALSLALARRRAAPDSATSLDRAEVVASLLARSRRNEPATAAYRALLARSGIPNGTRARFALGLGRARRAAGDFAAMDSAFLLASALDPAGPVGEQAAWERAREWEDRKPPLESAAVYSWAKPYLRSANLARTARVHGALSWLRAGSADSAGALLGPLAATESGEVPFWAGQVARARGDTANARANYEAATRNAPWSYEGLRAAELLAAPDGGAGVWPSEAEPFRMETPIRTPPRSPDAGRADPPLRTRILESLGLTPLALESLRECARDSERNAESSCADALEERGQFRGFRPAGDSVVASRWEYPPAYALEVFTAAERESLPPGLLWAIMRQESGYRRDVRSKARALGLLQLLPSTASQLAGHAVPEDSLYVAEVNVRLGALYVAKLAREFGDPRAVLAAYNAGEDAVRRWIRDRGPVDDRWVELIPYRETRDYVKQVYAAWRRYESLYGTRAR
jgi:soluble lytic murein transglycosylase-like protein